MSTGHAVFPLRQSLIIFWIVDVMVFNDPFSFNPVQFMSEQNLPYLITAALETLQEQKSLGIFAGNFCSTITADNEKLK